MTTRRGPTEEQLAAAIEGARDMPEASRGGASGAPPSRTTAGQLDPDNEPVEPDEAMKRETAVFVPGTHGKKPHG